MNLSLRSRFVGVIGNILGHYDRALFGLLAPFIAPLFFSTSDPLTALILTYGILPLGIITKPLGALFFGWMGDRFGRRKSLFYSLLGMSFVAILKGCLPTYDQVGIVAPCLLAAGRMLQSFFAAGQSANASIFILENTPLKNRSLMSSFYDVSSMSGIWIASGLVTFFCMQGWIEDGWRLLFWIGGLKAAFGLLLKTEEEREFQTRPKWNLFQTLKEYRGALVSIGIASGFSFATYTLAFTLMNGYVPLVTSLSKADVMKVNTALLAIDMFLLPCFGFLAHKFGKEKIMLIGALCSSASALPLFYYLDGASLAMVTAIRFVIVFFGVAFAAPYHAWKLELVPPEHRSTIVSLGCTLGSRLIGAPTSVLCLWMYQQSGYVWAPGIYLMIIGLLAGIVIYRQKSIESISQTPLP